MLRLGDGRAVLATRCNGWLAMRGSIYGPECLDSGLVRVDRARESKLEIRLIRGVERTGQGGGR